MCSGHSRDDPSGCGNRPFILRKCAFPAATETAASQIQMHIEYYPWRCPRGNFGGSLQLSYDSFFADDSDESLGTEENRILGGKCSCQAADSSSDHLLDKRTHIEQKVWLRTPV